MLIAYVAAVHPFGVLDVFWGPRAHNWFTNQSGLRRLLLLSYLGSSGAEALVRARAVAVAARAVAGAMRALSRGARGRSSGAARGSQLWRGARGRSSGAARGVAALARRAGSQLWRGARGRSSGAARAVALVGPVRRLFVFRRAAGARFGCAAIAARYGAGVQPLSDFRAFTPVFSLSAMSTPAAYGDALQEVFDIICEWNAVPLCTAEVGDFAARVFAAETRLEAAYAANAGASAGIPAECRTVLSNLRAEFRAFAVESWLERFPGFVADLAPRLRAYASELRAAERRVADAGDEEPDPHACLWVFLLALKESHDARRMPDEDYEWFRARAHLALSELAVSSALAAGAVGTATTVVAAAVTQPAPSSHATAAASPALPAVPFVALLDPPAPALARPAPRIVRPPSIDVAVASSTVAPDVAEGRSSSLKRARSSPDAGSSRSSRCVPCQLGHSRCESVAGSSKCARCLRMGCACEFRTSSTTLAPPVAGSLGPSPPSSTSPSPSPVAVSPVQASPIQALPVQASLVQASPVLSGLDFAEVDRLGAVAFWRGEVARARAAAEAARAHLQLAERSLSLALGELVAPPVQAVPSSSRASSRGRGGVGKGKEKKRK
ncbi:hypothetical protein EDB85DRAFT_2155750 [Lactarius pseudohatsudake]|nr:hypothetical protein EDB85DRAFT_2155750 [Lactarius pseudohatsudake]